MILLFLLSCFTATFVVTRSPLTDLPRSVVIRISHKLSSWLGNKVEYLLSCWLCSGAWASLIVYLLERSIIHVNGYSLASEMCMYSLSGAGFTYLVGKAVDFVEEYIEVKKIETIPAAEFDVVKSEVESESGEPPTS